MSQVRLRSWFKRYKFWTRHHVAKAHARNDAIRTIKVLSQRLSEIKDASTAGPEVARAEIEKLEQRVAELREAVGKSVPKPSVGDLSDYGGTNYEVHKYYERHFLVLRDPNDKLTVNEKHEDSLDPNPHLIDHDPILKEIWIEALGDLQDFYRVLGPPPMRTRTGARNGE